MKTMKSKKSILVIVSALFALSACDNNSKDPLKGYPELKNGQAPFNRNNREQQEAKCSAVILTSPTLIASEGESVSQEIFVRSLVASTDIKVKSESEKIVLKNAPKGLSLGRLDSSAVGVRYVLKYSPALGTITQGQNFVAAEIELVPALEVKNFVQCSEKVGVVATRSKDVPVIAKTTKNLSVSLDSVKNETIQVDIKARNLKNKNDLALLVDFDDAANSKENPVYSLVQALREEQIQSLGNDMYRISYEVDMRIVRLLLEESLKKDKTSTEIKMLVQFTAVNSSAQMVSPSENVVIKVLRKIEEKPVTQTKPVPQVAKEQVKS